MKTNLFHFIVLWALIVLVQLSTYMLLDFTPILVAVVVTIIGTGLTLYLGLKVERKRIKDETEKEPSSSNVIWTINEHRKRQGLEPLNIIDKSNVINIPPVPQPSAHFLVSGDRIQTLVPPETNIRVVDFGFSEPDEMFLAAPVPQPKMTDTAFISKASHDLLDRNRAAIKAEVYEDPVTQDICKHCYQKIRGVIHTEGMNRGRMRCDTADTMSAYGYNAEPTGSDCGVTCLGYK